MLILRYRGAQQIPNPRGLSHRHPRGRQLDFPVLSGGFQELSHLAWAFFRRVHVIHQNRILLDSSPRFLQKIALARLFESLSRILSLRPMMILSRILLSANSLGEFSITSVAFEGV